MWIVWMLKSNVWYLKRKLSFRKITSSTSYFTNLDFLEIRESPLLFATFWGLLGRHVRSRWNLGGNPFKSTTFAVPSWWGWLPWVPSLGVSMMPPKKRYASPRPRVGVNILGPKGMFLVFFSGLEDSPLQNHLKWGRGLGRCSFFSVLRFPIPTSWGWLSRPSNLPAHNRQRTM